MSVGIKTGRHFYINEADILNKLAKSLYSCICEAEETIGNISFVCIGSDRATGDSLGPIIGHMLGQKVQNNNVKIYGNLNKPVHAANIWDIMDRVYSENRGSLIIAIDAALSKQADRVGIVNIGVGSVNPGAFAEKKLPAVGHIYMTGVVNWAGRLNDIETLQSTRLGFVMEMADIMASGIGLAIEKWQKRHML